MFKKAIGLAVVAFLAMKSVEILNFIGFFQHNFKHHPGTCRRVKELDFGSEDLEVVSDGLAFVSSGLLFPMFKEHYRNFLRNNDIKGRIYAVDLKKPQTEAKELKIKASNNFQPSTFRPHGISVLEDTTKGQHLLYVVNHPDGGEDRVEKFRYLPDTGELEHVRSFSSEQLRITNDLAVTGMDTFYISNCMYYKSEFMSAIEMFSQMKSGGILYHNGSEFSSAASMLVGPNGLTVSRDSRYLYVGMPNLQYINVYKVNSDATLELMQEVYVRTMIDNLHLSQDGKSLFAGCHPIAIEIAKHIHDPRNYAPSQVLNLPLKDGLIDVNGISQVFYDHGDLISGSSIASIYDKKLLIGSVINKLVVCDLP